MYFYRGCEHGRVSGEGKGCCVAESRLDLWWKDDISRDMDFLYT